MERKLLQIGAQRGDTFFFFCLFFLTQLYVQTRDKAARVLAIPFFLLLSPPPLMSP